MDDPIKRAIAERQLPVDKTQLLGALINSDGSYSSQEGQNWDFKREWPFSYSDDYFGGIARLICAFANAQGGIIIFGVHDETRIAGYNRVKPQMLTSCSLH
jgi:Putative DNA-binding domain